MHQRRRPARAGMLAAAVTLLLVLGVAPGTAAPADPAAVNPSGDIPVVRLDGRGHGHGVGMSQWGAYTMARRGSSAADILAFFYPGTTLATVGGEVRVGVQTSPSVRIRLPQGGELRSARGGEQATGFPIPLGPGAVVEIVHDGSAYRVNGVVQAAGATGAQRFSAAEGSCILGLCRPDDDPPPPTTEPAPSPPSSDPPASDPPASDPPAEGGPPAAPPSSAPPGEPAQPAPDAPASPTPVWAVPAGGGLVEAVDRGRTYRGVFEVVGGPGQLRIRNHVDIEQYLAGMAEVPGTWPAASVQAQTIAARTYALRAVAGGGELCDSDRCQVYVGVGKESPGQWAAVEATRGVVVTFGGGLAATFYSASGGGHTANIREGFGTNGDVAYLPSRPYETDNAKAWRVDVALTDVAARLGYPGAITGVRITESGPSGRPIAMAVDGDAGSVAVDPQEFRRRLGLQSTWFTATVTTAAQASTLPDPIQDQLTSSNATSPVTADFTEPIDIALDVPAIFAPGPAPAAGSLPTAGPDHLDGRGPRIVAALPVGGDRVSGRAGPAVLAIGLALAVGFEAGRELRSRRTLRRRRS